MAEDLKELNAIVKRRVGALKRVAEISADNTVYFGPFMSKKAEIARGLAIGEVIYSNFASSIPTGALEDYIASQAEQELQSRFGIYPLENGMRIEDYIVGQAQLEMETRYGINLSQNKIKIKDKDLKKEQASSIKANKTTKQRFTDTNKQLYQELVGLRRTQRLQQEWLDSTGVGSLTKKEKEIVRKQMKMAGTAELLVGSQMSANLELYNGETALTNEKFVKIENATSAYNLKTKDLNSEGMLVSLFERNFDLVAGTKVKIAPDGTLEFYDSKGRPVEAESVVQPNEDKDKVLGTVKQFEAFVRDTKALSQTPAKISKLYNNQIDQAIANSIESSPIRAGRKERAEDIKKYVEKMASNENLHKFTLDYLEYNNDLNRIKVQSNAKSALLYESILNEYQALFGDEDVQGFMSQVQSMNDSELAEKIRGCKKRMGVEPVNMLTAGKDTMEAMQQTIESVNAKYQEIIKENVMDFKLTEALNLDGGVSPVRTQDGSYAIFDPTDRRAGDDGYYFVTNFKTLRDKYVSLNDDLAVEDLNEEQFFAAIESGELEYGKLTSLREKYNSFLDEKVKVEYLRERAFENAKTAIENQQPIKFLNGDGKLVSISYEIADDNEKRGVWVCEVEGEEKRNLLSFADQKTAEQLENGEDITAFIQDEIMPSIYKTINYDNPTLNEDDIKAIQKKKEDLDRRYSKDVAKEIENLGKMAQAEKDAEQGKSQGGQQAENQNPNQPNNENDGRNGTGQNEQGGQQQQNGGNNNQKPQPQNSNNGKGNEQGKDQDQQQNGGNNGNSQGQNSAGGNNPPTNGGNGLGGGSGSSQNQQGEVTVTWQNAVYKSQGLNYEAMLKMWSVKLCMTHDQKIDACASLALRYSVLQPTIKVAPFNGNVTVVYNQNQGSSMGGSGSSPNNENPTGGNNPVDDGPVLPTDGNGVGDKNQNGSKTEEPVEKDSEKSKSKENDENQEQKADEQENAQEKEKQDDESKNEKEQGEESKIDQEKKSIEGEEKSEESEGKEAKDEKIKNATKQESEKIVSEEDFEEYKKQEWLNFVEVIGKKPLRTKAEIDEALKEFEENDSNNILLQRFNKDWDSKYAKEKVDGIVSEENIQENKEPSQDESKDLFQEESREQFQDEPLKEENEVKQSREENQDEELKTEHIDESQVETEDKEINFEKKESEEEKNSNFEVDKEKSSEEKNINSEGEQNGFEENNKDTNELKTEEGFSEKQSDSKEVVKFGEETNFKEETNTEESKTNSEVTSEDSNENQFYSKDEELNLEEKQEENQEPESKNEDSIGKSSIENKEEKSEKPQEEKSVEESGLKFEKTQNEGKEKAPEENVQKEAVQEQEVETNVFEKDLEEQKKNEWLIYLERVNGKPFTSQIEKNKALKELEDNNPDNFLLKRFNKDWDSKHQKDKVEEQSKSEASEEREIKAPYLTEKGQRAQEQLEDAKENLKDIEAKISRRENERKIRHLNGAHKDVLNNIERLEQVIKRETVRDLSEKGKEAQVELEKMEENLGGIDAKLKETSNPIKRKILEMQRNSYSKKIKSLEDMVEKETLYPKESGEKEIESTQKYEERTQSEIVETPKHFEEQEINFGEQPAQEENAEQKDNQEQKPKTEAEFQAELNDFLNKPADPEINFEANRQENNQPVQENQAGNSALDRVKGASSGGRKLTEEEIRHLEEIANNPEFGMDA